jgi:hypothetical protein
MRCVSRRKDALQCVSTTDAVITTNAVFARTKDEANQIASCFAVRNDGKTRYIIAT